MRARTILTVGAFVVLLVIVGIYLMCHTSGRTAIDRFVFPEDTEYAPQFSEHAFDQVTPGMTIGDVKQILGDPLQIVEGTSVSPIRTYLIRDGIAELKDERESSETATRIVYYYSRPGARFQSYYVRNVIFNAEGEVVEIVKEFHAD